MRSLSKEEARLVGTELKRWSQRPIGATNMRVLGLYGVLAMLGLFVAQSLPAPAAAIRSLAAMSAVVMATVHFILLRTLRGLLRAGVVEAQDAMSAMQDPRRISAFDMAMTWLLVAAIAGYCE
jgi:hypothetical protein